MYNKEIDGIIENIHNKSMDECNKYINDLEDKIIFLDKKLEILNKGKFLDYGLAIAGGAITIPYMLTGPLVFLSGMKYNDPVTSITGAGATIAGLYIGFSYKINFLERLEIDSINRKEIPKESDKIWKHLEKMYEIRDNLESIQ